MNKYLGLTKKFLLLGTIGVASTLTTSPSKAATFAESNGNLIFTEFSQNPDNVATDTYTNTPTISEGGIVGAIAQAEAFFLIEPPVAFNSSLSETFGENQDYLGLVESEASVIGNFDIDADTFFSFDFLADLNLATSIDNPSQENARASGDISFALIDAQTNSILDYFGLVGNLTTEGNNDFVAVPKSDNVTLETFTESNFSGLQESLTTVVEGSTRRYFANETTLALVEVKRNRVKVTAPEPSSSLALLVSSGVISLVLKRRRKSTDFSVWKGKVRQ